MGERTTRAVRLAGPALIVAALALVALWRVGPAPTAGSAIGTTGIVPPYPPDASLSRVGDTLLANAVGREASLERIVVREITSRDTFWAGAIDEEPVFAALATNVTRGDGVELREGSEVTLIGRVRAAPEEQEAVARWRIDGATAAAVRKIGTYLEVTEIR